MTHSLLIAATIMAFLLTSSWYPEGPLLWQCEKCHTLSTKGHGKVLHVALYLMLYTVYVFAD